MADRGDIADDNLNDILEKRNNKASCSIPNKRRTSTVWKFQDFYVIRILREINFGESRSTKNGVFAIFGALNLVELVIFSLQKVQKFIKTII